ncbi:MAG: energy transducer TonB, partial [Deltaproteobacteria bacterium]|nr:energy transducer TonB [Deltaproteobacteria bacterium]
GNDQRSKGDDGQKPPPEPEKPKPAPDKPKPKAKAVEIDPDKPIERPAEATVPKKVGGDPVAYPAQLRERNITGKVKVRLTIYKDGSVKGAKVLAKENSADKDADPKLYELANKLFLKAVSAAVQTWKYEPSKYKGKAITVYLTITIPFSLD